MKISNYMNNTNSIMEKNTDKVQKGNSQTNEKHTVGQSVKLSLIHISRLVAESSSSAKTVTISQAVASYEANFTMAVSVSNKTQ